MVEKFCPQPDNPKQNASEAGAGPIGLPPPGQSKRGCRVGANNNLRYFTPSHHPQYAYDFSWRLTGFATCVPKDYVEIYQTHEYYGEYVDPIDY
jgi:hypothetical protein